MSETKIPFVCYYCGQATVNANDVLPRFEEGNGFECVSEDACKRRQKRDRIAAGRHFAPLFNPMTIMRAYGAINVIMATLVALCTLFMMAVVYIGLAFLFGF